ncbi:PTS system glucose-specific IIA component [Clostridium acetobutylicum]|uniref:PTS system, (Possibly glucose-specific) IIA component n=1 Tax=Clostridium acetobutylicum (strain ATCC 824 / DSM 792 / JCM 1419 / IAM 19013 / LMG 5710 / NBRC 13948 / NRRL B-527 / VKM B-1787 / 2291 / W) TaxID=272562 RepID=Q97DP5_CLOAB|nr:MULTISPECIES: PTS glucose transporter subunit IIA [Clostridium]AAK81357.1 PTS system, (possibly glucose-specific) IIA component [Clostridium acetobutylicum ATCC 824]ADZ22468.1 PTS system, (possibly glucose-specific) IIA component [Clostridium acetobutylicum EA 2018]AEI33103.1 PTS system IIA component [Clostridium acetobutylicum DSM 1731]AWV80975.1 PTS glucose transporter subunit IIA [Clostridium acetobutylicum]MBC2393701.1 PTS glucose transporter subunit IIA [Clostridium acetobutylicum]
MFKKLFSKNSNRVESVFAYASGKLLNIEDVPDPIFSEKSMGEGVAILPSDGRIVAPVDGEIILIAPTKHALALKTTLGQEILIHIGLETVMLNGQGIELLIGLGDKVVAGQNIANIDLDFIKKNASSTVIPMVITNSEEDLFDFEWEDVNEVSAGETKIFKASCK